MRDREHAKAVSDENDRALRARDLLDDALPPGIKTGFPNRLGRRGGPRGFWLPSGFANDRDPTPQPRYNQNVGVG